MMATPSAVGRDVSASVLIDHPGSSARSGGSLPTASESPTCSSDGAAAAGWAMSRVAAMTATVRRTGRKVETAAVLATTAQAPPPPALAAAIVRQAGEDITARLTFSAPVARADASAGRRICVMFAAGRACLHGTGARVARRRHGTWVLIGPARVSRSGDAVTIRAAAARLQVALGTAAPWTATSTIAGSTQTLNGTLHTRALVPFAPRRHLRLLATGDSMVQVFDSFLADRLPAHRVIGEAHVSTGISKPKAFGIDWVRHAAAQARSIHPDVTVVWIGPNEGFPIA